MDDNGGDDVEEEEDDEVEEDGFNSVSCVLDSVVLRFWCGPLGREMI